MPVISSKELQTLLEYNPDTGIFTRLTNSKGFKAGDIAGSCNSSGRLVIEIDGRRYLAHVLAWVYMKDKWPRYDVNHCDKNRSNNAWDNLEEITNIEKALARKVKSNNTSGYKGVFQDHVTGKWTALCRNIYLGKFYSKHDGARAYNLAAILQGGKFAQINNVRQGFQFPKDKA